MSAEPLPLLAAAGAPGQPVVFYSHDDLREVVDARVRRLADGPPGLLQLGAYRDLFPAFAAEALASGSIVLGQFAPDAVYAFTPAPRALEPETVMLARSKALELLATDDPPLVLDLLESQNGEPPLSPHARIEAWAPPKMLEGAVYPRAIAINLFYDAATLYRASLAEPLDANGFEVLTGYEEAARRARIRVRRLRSPESSDKRPTFSVPWMAWVREMFCGGYTTRYPQVCALAYIDRLVRSAPSPESS